MLPIANSVTSLCYPRVPGGLNATGRVTEQMRPAQPGVWSQMSRGSTQQELHDSILQILMRPDPAVPDGAQQVFSTQDVLEAISAPLSQLRKEEMEQEALHAGRAAADVAKAPRLLSKEATATLRKQLARAKSAATAGKDMIHLSSIIQEVCEESPSRSVTTEVEVPVEEPGETDPTVDPLAQETAA